MNKAKWKSSKRKKEIDGIIKKAKIKRSDSIWGSYPDGGHYDSTNWYLNIYDSNIFDNYLEKLKKVCPDHIQVKSYLRSSKIVFVYIQKNKIKFNQESNTNTKTKSNKPTVKSLWDSGIHKMTKIAKQLNISTYKVKKELERLGIK